jgi:hypothetical protein
MGMMIKVIACFIDKKTGKPLSGNDLVVKLYDKDIFDDDFLGEAKLNDKGKVEIFADLDDASSIDTPLEGYPDLYFVLQNQTGVIFESKVFHNVDFLSDTNVSQQHFSATHDLGTLEV